MMRTLVLSSLVLGLCGCGTTRPTSEFSEPNTILKDEVDRRINQIPFQHRDELLNSMVWLVGVGESAVPQLIVALDHTDPKVRSSAVWCVGRIGDRRVIPYLKQHNQREHDPIVRLESSRTLLWLGDYTQVPVLIEGLESDRTHVRYLCHEALRADTGRDFGYDHRVENTSERQAAVSRWREWWHQQQTGGAQRTDGRSRLETIGSSPANPALSPAKIPAAPGAAAPNTAPVAPNAGTSPDTGSSITLDFGATKPPAERK
jgi:hypothetical protein